MRRWKATRRCVTRRARKPRRSCGLTRWACSTPSSPGWRETGRAMQLRLCGDSSSCRRRSRPRRWRDTAFYRHAPLLSRTDVGFDATRFSMAIDEWHERMAGRALDWPGAMLATATHDHKRGEDVPRAVGGPERTARCVACLRGAMAGGRWRCRSRRCLCVVADLGRGLAGGAVGGGRGGGARHLASG